MTKHLSGFKQTEICEIPEDWEIINIENLGKVVTGKTPPTADRDNYGGDIPFICIPDLGNNVYVSETNKTLTEKGVATVKNCLLPENSIAVSCIATIGLVGIVERPSVTNQQVNTIIPNEKITPIFLYYRLQNFEDLLSSYGGGGSVFSIISKSKFESIPLAIPPLNEQQQIASILSSLDDKIELNKRMNKTLEEIGKALFKRWFVDFDFPNDNDKPYKSSSGEMVDSELGKIPEGWGVKNLRAILLEIQSGRRPKGGVGQYVSGVPSIGAENIKGLANYDYFKEKYIPEDYFDKLGQGILKHKDVLLYKDGAQIGRKTIYRNDFPHKRCCVNEHVFILRAKNNIQNFLYFWLDQPTMTAEIINLNSNAAQPGINQEAIKSLKILVPNDDVLNTFDIFIEGVLSKIYENVKENHFLSQILDSLLPRLMSGKLRVN